MAETTKEGTLAIAITEPTTSNVARHAYALHVSNADGSAAGEGVQVEVTLDGPGSLSPAFSAKEQKRLTDANGNARVDWFRRGIFDRDIKATLSASVAVEGASLTFQEIEWARSDTSYNFPTKKLRF